MVIIATDTISTIGRPSVLQHMRILDFQALEFTRANRYRWAVSRILLFQADPFPRQKASFARARTPDTARGSPGGWDFAWWSSHWLHKNLPEVDRKTGWLHPHRSAGYNSWPPAKFVHHIRACDM